MPLPSHAEHFRMPKDLRGLPPRPSQVGQAMVARRLVSRSCGARLLLNAKFLPQATGLFDIGLFALVLNLPTQIDGRAVWGLE